jgi:hypothetical protein
VIPHVILPRMYRDVFGCSYRDGRRQVSRSERRSVPADVPQCSATEREFKSPLAHPVMSQDIGDCHETGHPSRTHFSRGASKP